MSLEAILQALEADAERQIAGIEQAMQAELGRIQAQAQETAAAVRQEQLKAIQAPLRTEQTRLLNRARLEAMQIVLEAREAMLSLALEAAARRLANLSATAAYEPVLKQLTQMAVETLGGEDNLQLRVRACDVRLMESIIQELGLPAKVETGLEPDVSAWGSLGGVVVTTAGGNISLVNTLDERLQRAAQLYRSRIAEFLFGASQEK